MSCKKKMIVFKCNGEDYTIEVDENDTITHLMDLFFDESNSDNRLKTDITKILFYYGSEILNKPHNLPKKVSAFKFKQNAKIKVIDMGNVVGGFIKYK